MRFINMLGSKEYPIPKKEKKEFKIIKEFKNEKLCLQIIGKVDEKTKCKWTITFDEKTITPSSTGPILVLSKSNTIRYTKSTKTTVFVTIGDYTSPTFII